jgi:PPOX class probable F420-dependent enzyme
MKQSTVDREELVEFVRACGFGVVATRAPDGSPQAALVGVAATDRGEIVFDTLSGSRKCRNLQAFPRVALVIGWDDAVTLQCEGDAEIVSGTERDRCMRPYVAQHPDGVERAEDPDIVLVRVRLAWGRVSDFRPSSFGTQDLVL